MTKQKSLAQMQREAQKAQAQYQRQLEQQRKAQEKAEKERYLASRQQKVDQLNQELETQLEALRTILETGLQRTIKFEEMVDLAMGPALIPPQPDPLPAPPNPQAYQMYIPKPGLVEKVTGLGKFKREQTTRQVQYNYQQAIQAYENARQVYNNQINARKQAIETRLSQKQTFQQALTTKQADAVTSYFSTVLQHSPYPSTFPPAKVVLSYNPETGELILEYDLPQYDEIMPTIMGYKFIKTRDEIQEKPLTTTQERTQKKLYEDVIAAIALRVLHELFKADHMRAIELIILNGMANTVDKATGRDIRPCLVSVQVTKEDFAKLDLTRVDKAVCLKHLKAQTSPSYEEFVPIKPLVELVVTDKRFVEEVNVLSGLDSRPNLLEMSPGDFEHLIANLFTEMGFKTGTTTISRDGGVDVIAFDERPLVGGKIIIQAKRYRNTVGVESVRALYGVMQDEGAIKGILVTTSGFGTASREFAKDKPIELMDGNNLLYFLAEHGHEAKIEIPK
ncbi:MAG: restriction endonuclease [Chloroflexi bacterium]|nr:restriction endonuclease [Chloroflexota bacterium]